MLKQKNSRELAEPKRRLTPADLLAFVLTALLLLVMVSLSGADTWDDTLAKAKQEGELVAVLGGAASRLYRPIFKIFEEKFGIRTAVSTGSARRQSDRLLAERGARRYKVDIVMFGPTTGNRRMVANRVLDPIEPLLFLREVVDRSLWYKGKHYYSDPEQKHIFAFSGGADLTPISMRFNTDNLPIKEAMKMDSVWRFLDQRFAGKIVAIPPGGGSDYLTAYVHPDLGKKYLRRFFSSELDVKFSRDYRLISDGVAQGKYTIAIYVGSGGRDIDRLGKRGMPVANFGQIIKEPVKERPTLQGTGSSNNIMVLDKRPNPNATKIFLNWFLSKEGQTIRHTKSSGTPDQSFRVDVTEMGKVHEAEMRRPGVDYMMVVHDPDLQKMRPEATRFVEELYRKRQAGG